MKLRCGSWRQNHEIASCSRARAVSGFIREGGLIRKRVSALAG